MTELQDIFLSYDQEIVKLYPELIIEFGLQVNNPLQRQAKQTYTNYLDPNHIKTHIKLNRKYLAKIRKAKAKTQMETHYKTIFEKMLVDELESEKLPYNYLCLEHTYNPVVVFCENASGDGTYQFDTETDKQDFIVRAQQFTLFLKSMIMWLKEGIIKKITQSRITILLCITQLEDALKNKSWHHPDFDLGLDSILEPAIKDVLLFCQKEYLPHTMKKPGLSALGNAGKKMYDDSVYYNIDLNLDEFNRVFGTKETNLIKAIHKLGIREVRRLETLMSQFNPSKFQKELKYTSQNDLKVTFESHRKYIDKTIMKDLFQGLTINHQYVIKPIPKNSRNGIGGAYYIPGKMDGKRKGVFYYNPDTYAMENKGQSKALVAHEGNPGHHFQLTLQNELHIPFFVKRLAMTGFVEGWGLYCESLPKFTDAEYYGKLCLEMLRAVRLVVDTGLHAYGWSKNKAIKYYLEKTKSYKQDAETEINRYIALPGQALAYKIGELVFQKLKISYLESQLKNKKEKDLSKIISNYHKRVLTRGSMPLNILIGLFK